MRPALVVGGNFGQGARNSALKAAA
jgi:hypothetical protein